MQPKLYIPNYNPSSQIIIRFWERSCSIFFPKIFQDEQEHYLDADFKVIAFISNLLCLLLRWTRITHIWEVKSLNSREIIWLQSELKNYLLVKMWVHIQNIYFFLSSLLQYNSLLCKRRRKNSLLLLIQIHECHPQ